MRLLLGVQDGETNAQTTIDQTWDNKRQVLGTQVQKTEPSETRIMDSQELVMGPKPTCESDLNEETEGTLQTVQIGKIGVTWEEIKAAGGILNLELIKKGSIGDNKLTDDIGDKTSSRRKGIQRELHNLNFNIK